MKSVLHLLVVCMSVFNSSCAVMAMGQRKCEPREMPVRPVVSLCVSNEIGFGQCYNPVTGKNEVRSMLNHVCLSPSDFTVTEEWIKELER